MVRARLELSDFMSREHLLLTDPVTESGMNHRPENREAVGDRSLFGKQFTKAQSRSLRGNGVEGAPILRWRAWLGAPGFQMAGAAVQKDDDHGLRVSAAAGPARA